MNRLRIHSSSELIMVKRSVTIYNYERASHHKGSLIDGGSNGGLAGKDSFFLEEIFDTANVQGVTDDTLSDLPIGTAVGLVHMADGEPALLYMHQYAFYDKGGTVHSKMQWSALGADVGD